MQVKKSKILKILVVLIMILLITLSMIKVNSDSQIINKKTFTNNGGAYNSAFQNKGSNLYNIKMDDIINNYYTAGGSTNDYKDYILNSKDGYCLNENASDSGNPNFYVASIIDIEGEEVTVYTRSNKNGQKVHVGSIASEFAAVVYYKYHHPNGYQLDRQTGKDESPNKGFGEYWVNHWGWNKLFQSIETYIDDASIKPTYSLDNDMENYVKNNPDINWNSYDLSNLNIRKKGQLTTEHGDYIQNGETCKTRIGKYIITGATGLEYNIEIFTVSGKKYNGIYNSNDQSIYIKGQTPMTEEIKNVRVTQSYQNGYKARLIILGTGASQARMIGYGENVPISKSVEATDIPENQVNISLQKYITHVNDTPITTEPTPTGLTNRKNKRTSADEQNSSTVKDSISKENSVIEADKEKYKRDNAVRIKKNDVVTYRIEVYNNSNTDATNISLKDSMSYYNKDGELCSYGTIESVCYSYDDTKIDNDIKDKWEIDTSLNNTYKYKIEKLETGRTMYFEVKVKYITHSGQILRNTVWISSTGQENSKEYRTADSDYVKMEQYKVSLEKFVTEVTDAYGNNSVKYNRSNHRYNENLAVAEGSKNKDTYKKEIDSSRLGSGPVKVEVGDIVTFTIRLKNEGTTDVKITKIYDTCTVTNYRGLELKSIDEGNGEATITKTEIRNNAKGDPSLIRYEITFADETAKVITGGNYVDVKIKFEVTSKSSGSGLSYRNKAGIIEIKNANNSPVSDSNGTADNYDTDWLETKEYAVSLEKFVSKVNNVEVTPNRAEHRYNNNLSDVADGTLPNKDTYKKDVDSSKVGSGPVKVDVGDTVTYTIRLRNTGDTPVKITQICDTLIADGVAKLKINTNSTKMYNKEGQQVTGVEFKFIGEYKGPEKTWSLKDIERYLITIEGAPLLNNKDDYVDITINFNVEVSDENSEVTLWNMASIMRQENRNNKKAIDSDEDDNNCDMDWVITETYSVSLEKYITEVTDGDGKNGVSYNNRQGYRYNNQELSEDKIVTESENEDDITRSPYKQNNKVLAEQGDKVTFTIKLKNTGETPVKITKIYDTFINHEDGYRLEYDEEYGIRNQNGEDVVGTVINRQYKETEWGSKNCDRYLIELENAPLLNANQSTYITIRFKIHGPSGVTETDISLYNKAAIVERQNRNNVSVGDSDGFANNYDMDWLKLKTYSVSLEKFVTEVTDIYGNNGVTYDNRHNKRLNEEIVDPKLADDTENKYSYKYKNKVKVEIGDIVTFTIRLKNESEDTQVKVTKLEDTYYYGKLEGEANLTLYKENGEIKGNGTATVSDITPTDNPYQTRMCSIEFADAILLEPKEYVDVTVKFNVYATAGNAILRNKAKIDEIKNRNDVSVGDSDGTDNNVDTDWLITKEYKVSLEKYVSKVKKTDGDIELYDYRENHPQYWQKNTNDYKYKRPVTVSNGDKVTYTIKLKNDSEETKAIITNVADYLPDGIKYGEISYRGNTYCTTFEHKPYETDNGQTDNIINFTDYIVLLPSQNYSFDITVEVIEPNVSLNVLKNVAEIISMKNRNDITVIDTTPNNNKDADYIQLDWGGSTVVDLIVEKQWEDYNNEDGKRPASIQVQLYRNGFEQGEPITLNAENNWEYTWKDKQKYHPNGSEYVYTVKEISIVDDYVTTYNINGNKTTIINKYSPEPPPNQDPISKTVTKEWLYDSEDVRPDSIQVQLLRNGEVPTDIEDNKVTLNAENNWKYTWNNLKKCDENGAEYIYQVRELTVLKDYNVEYSEDGFKIINKYDAPESPDVIIGGYVWNDIAIDKIQGNYDGILDTNKENALEGIKVYLYRKDVEQAISVKETNKDGYYSFANKDIDRNVVKNQYERYIKGPKATNPDTGETTQRWAGEYYSYYVVFEYDGITYTSTPNGTSYEDIIDSSKDYRTDSNAREDNGRVKEGRSSFNNKFSTINNEKEIEYTTKNENGYIPQSNHKYNSNMAMQSSTELLSFSTLFSGKDYSKDEDLNKIRDIEDKIKYVGLGLRGRDIFDLELTSDVDTIKVTVNSQQGVYRYSNKVNLRQQDLNADSNIDEDMANKISESSNTYVDRQDQNIRNEDFDVTQADAKNPYDSNQGVQGIEVTYKITVHNASNTDGTATKITNYYDDAYTFVKAYSNEPQIEEMTIDNKKAENGESGTDYKSVIITTPGTNLSQSQTMEIYVVYNLHMSALNRLTKENPIPTFNMAEITEYTTKCAEGQTEYTRGLIDKDSAPGSGNKEQVRLTTTEGQSTKTVDGNPTTVEYYFEASKLDKLKYEDDTYATPTLYFVIPNDENIRTITGTVFRDETVVDATTRIKTGNGKLDEGEVGVFGATVQLIEQVDDGKVRYETTTNTEGKFEFTGFLPGNYIIRYYYGDTANTVLLNQSGNVNAYSFNGEDYQSTNNAYNLTVKDESGNELTTNLLSTAENFWYAYNEGVGVSTAIDNSNRRKTVSANVLDTTIFTDTNKTNSDEVMIRLNEARKGELSNERLNTSLPKGTLIEQTYMFADTELMVLTVEKTELVTEGENQVPKQKEQFSEYKISNMNFGIAEVPVTIIDLQKEVQSFTVMDSVGQNILAAASKKDDGTWDDESIKGDVIVVDGLNTISVQIEDEKLQGARLQTTYSIRTKLGEIQLNYDKTGVKATIEQLVDIIDNNLSYNPSLGNNSTYWGLRTTPMTTDDSSLENISTYTTIVEATGDAKAKLNNGEAIEITLEKVLSSTNATIEEIITSTVNSYEYENIFEITELNYENYTPEVSSEPQRDRIRTKEGYIIIPGVQHDTAKAEAMAITPPTGDSGISIVYYIIAGISLVVLAVGVFGIKKFVVNTKK